MPRRSVRSPKPVVQDAAIQDVVVQDVVVRDAMAQALTLGENLDLTATGELARSLTAARGAPITVDASQVRHIGAQCGQVLVSAARTWDADQKPFNLLNPSAEFTAGLHLLGLESALASKEISQ